MAEGRALQRVRVWEKVESLEERKVDLRLNWISFFNSDEFWSSQEIDMTEDGADDFLWGRAWPNARNLQVSIEAYLFAWIQLNAEVYQYFSEVALLRTWETTHSRNTLESGLDAEIELISAFLHGKEGLRGWPCLQIMKIGRGNNLPEIGEATQKWIREMAKGWNLSSGEARNWTVKSILGLIKPWKEDMPGALMLHWQWAIVFDMDLKELFSHKKWASNRPLGWNTLKKIEVWKDFVRNCKFPKCINIDDPDNNNYQTEHKSNNRTIQSLQEDPVFYLNHDKVPIHEVNRDYLTAVIRLQDFFRLYLLKLQAKQGGASVKIILSQKRDANWNIPIVQGLSQGETLRRGEVESSGNSGNSSSSTTGPLLEGIDGFNTSLTPGLDITDHQNIAQTGSGDSITPLGADPLTGKAWAKGTQVLVAGRHRWRGARVTGTSTGLVGSLEICYLRCGILDVIPLTRIIQWDEELRDLAHNFIEQALRRDEEDNLELPELKETLPLKHEVKPGNWEGEDSGVSSGSSEDFISILRQGPLRGMFEVDAPTVPFEGRVRRRVPGTKNTDIFLEWCYHCKRAVSKCVTHICSDCQSTTCGTCDGWPHCPTGNDGWAAWDNQLIGLRTGTPWDNSRLQRTAPKGEKEINIENMSPHETLEVGLPITKIEESVNVLNDNLNTTRGSASCLEEGNNLSARGCFSGDTVVTVQIGGGQCIEDICEGDKIWNGEESNGGWLEIVKIHRFTGMERFLWKIPGGDGKLTSDHLIMRPDACKWSRVSDAGYDSENLQLVDTSWEVFALQVRADEMRPWLHWGKFKIRLLGGQCELSDFEDPGRDSWWTSPEEVLKDELYIDPPVQLDIMRAMYKLKKDISGMWSQTTEDHSEIVSFWVQRSVNHEKKMFWVIKHWFHYPTHYHSGHWEWWADWEILESEQGIVCKDTRRVDTPIWVGEILNDDTLVWKPQVGNGHPIHWWRDHSDRPFKTIQDIGIGLNFRLLWLIWFEKNIKFLKWNKVVYTLKVFKAAGEELAQARERELGPTPIFIVPRPTLIRVRMWTDVMPPEKSLTAQSILDYIHILINASGKTWTDRVHAIIRWIHALQDTLRKLASQVIKVKKDFQAKRDMGWGRIYPHMIRKYPVGRSWDFDVRQMLKFIQDDATGIPLRIVLQEGAYLKHLEKNLKNAFGIYKDGLRGVRWRDCQCLRINNEIQHWTFGSWAYLLTKDSDEISVGVIIGIHEIKALFICYEQLGSQNIHKTRPEAISVLMDHPPIRIRAGPDEGTSSITGQTSTSGGKVTLFLTFGKAVSLYRVWVKRERLARCNSLWNQALDRWLTNPAEEECFRATQTPKGLEEFFARTDEVSLSRKFLQLCFEDLLKAIRNLENSILEHIKIVKQVRGWRVTSKASGGEVTEWAQDLDLILKFIQSKQRGTALGQWPYDCVTEGNQELELATLKEQCKALLDTCYKEKQEVWKAQEENHLRKEVRYLQECYSELTTNMDFDRLTPEGRKEERRVHYMICYIDKDLLSYWCDADFQNILKSGVNTPLTFERFRKKLRLLRKLPSLKAAKVEGVMNPFGGEGPEKWCYGQCFASRWEVLLHLIMVHDFTLCKAEKFSGFKIRIPITEQECDKSWKWNHNRGGWVNQRGDIRRKFWIRCPQAPLHVTSRTRALSGWETTEWELEKAEIHATNLKCFGCCLEEERGRILFQEILYNKRKEMETLSGTNCNHTFFPFRKSRSRSCAFLSPPPTASSSSKCEGIMNQYGGEGPSPRNYCCATGLPPDKHYWNKLFVAGQWEAYRYTVGGCKICISLLNTNRLSVFFSENNKFWKEIWLRTLAPGSDKIIVAKRKGVVWIGSFWDPDTIFWKTQGGPLIEEIWKRNLRIEIHKAITDRTYMGRDAKRSEAWKNFLGEPTPQKPCILRQGRETTQNCKFFVSALNHYIGRFKFWKGNPDEGFIRYFGPFSQIQDILMDWEFENFKSSGDEESDLCFVVDLADKMLEELFEEHKIHMLKTSKLITSRMGCLWPEHLNFGAWNKDDEWGMSFFIEILGQRNSYQGVADLAKSLGKLSLFMDRWKLCFGAFLALIEVHKDKAKVKMGWLSRIKHKWTDRNEKVRSAMTRTFQIEEAFGISQISNLILKGRWWDESPNGHNGTGWGVPRDEEVRLGGPPISIQRAPTEGEMENPLTSVEHFWEESQAAARLQFWESKYKEEGAWRQLNSAHSRFTNSADRFDFPLRTSDDLIDWETWVLPIWQNSNSSANYLQESIEKYFITREDLIEKALGLLRLIINRRNMNMVDRANSEKTYLGKEPRWLKDYLKGDKPNTLFGGWPLLSTWNVNINKAQFNLSTHIRMIERRGQCRRQELRELKGAVKDFREIWTGEFFDPPLAEVWPIVVFYDQRFKIKIVKPEVRLEFAGRKKEAFHWMQMQNSWEDLWVDTSVHALIKQGKVEGIMNQYGGEGPPTERIFHPGYHNGQTEGPESLAGESMVMLLLVGFWKDIWAGREVLKLSVRLAEGCRVQVAILSPFNPNAEYSWKDMGKRSYILVTDDQGIAWEGFFWDRDTIFWRVAEDIPGEMSHCWTRVCDEEVCCGSNLKRAFIKSRGEVWKQLLDSKVDKETFKIHLSRNCTLFEQAIEKIMEDSRLRNNDFVKDIWWKEQFLVAQRLIRERKKGEDTSAPFFRGVELLVQAMEVNLTYDWKAHGEFLAEFLQNRTNGEGKLWPWHLDFFKWQDADRWGKDSLIKLIDRKKTFEEVKYVISCLCSLHVSYLQCKERAAIGISVINALQGHHKEVDLLLNRKKRTWKARNNRILEGPAHIYEIREILGIGQIRNLCLDNLWWPLFEPELENLWKHTENNEEEKGDRRIKRARIPAMSLPSRIYKLIFTFLVTDLAIARLIVWNAKLCEDDKWLSYDLQFKNFLESDDRTSFAVPTQAADVDWTDWGWAVWEDTHVNVRCLQELQELYFNYRINLIRSIHQFLVALKACYCWDLVNRKAHEDIIIGLEKELIDAFLINNGAKLRFGGWPSGTLTRLGNGQAKLLPEKKITVFRSDQRFTSRRDKTSQYVREQTWVKSLIRPWGIVLSEEKKANWPILVVFDQNLKVKMAKPEIRGAVRYGIKRVLHFSEADLEDNWVREDVLFSGKKTEGVMNQYGGEGPDPPPRLPANMSERDLLGLKAPLATVLEIKAAYKKRSLEYHPDKNRGVDYATEHFRRIREAYEFMLKRAEEREAKEEQLRKLEEEREEKEKKQEQQRQQQSGAPTMTPIHSGPADHIPSRKAETSRDGSKPKENLSLVGKLCWSWAFRGCPVGEKCIYRHMWNETEKMFILTKMLLRNLRHKTPTRERQDMVKISDEGFAWIKAILRLNWFLNKKITRSDVVKIATSDMDGRFEIRQVNNDWLIRAMEGHSLPQVLDYNLYFPLPQLPELCVHDTFLATKNYKLRKLDTPWDDIVKMGLRILKRNHIYTWSPLELTSPPWRSRQGATVRIVLHNAKLEEQGISFLRSSEESFVTRGKIFLDPDSLKLTRGIPKECFKEIWLIKEKKYLYNEQDWLKFLKISPESEERSYHWVREGMAEETPICEPLKSQTQVPISEKEMSMQYGIGFKLVHKFLKGAKRLGSGIRSEDASAMGLETPLEPEVQGVRHHKNRMGIGSDELVYVGAKRPRYDVSHSTASSSQDHRRGAPESEPDESSGLFFIKGAWRIVKILRPLGDNEEVGIAVNYAGVILGIPKERFKVWTTENWESQERFREDGWGELKIRINADKPFFIRLWLNRDSLISYIFRWGAVLLQTSEGNLRISKGEGVLQPSTTLRDEGIWLDHVGKASWKNNEITVSIVKENPEGDIHGQLRQSDHHHQGGHGNRRNDQQSNRQQQQRQQSKMPQQKQEQQQEETEGVMNKYGMEGPRRKMLLVVFRGGLLLNTRYWIKYLTKLPIEGTRILISQKVMVGTQFPEQPNEPNQGQEKGVGKGRTPQNVQNKTYILAQDKALKAFRRLLIPEDEDNLQEWEANSPMDPLLNEVFKDALDDHGTVLSYKKGEGWRVIQGGPMEEHVQMVHLVFELPPEGNSVSRPRPKHIGGGIRWGEATLPGPRLLVSTWKLQDLDWIIENILRFYMKHTKTPDADWVIKQFFTEGARRTIEFWEKLDDAGKWEGCFKVSQILFWERIYPKLSLGRETGLRQESLKNTSTWIKLFIVHWEWWREKSSIYEQVIMQGCFKWSLSGQEVPKEGRWGLDPDDLKVPEVIRTLGQGNTIGLSMRVGRLEAFCLHDVYTLLGEWLGEVWEISETIGRNITETFRIRVSLMIAEDCVVVQNNRGDLNSFSKIVRRGGRIVWKCSSFNGKITDFFLDSVNNLGDSLTITWGHRWNLEASGNTPAGVGKNKSEETTLIIWSRQRISVHLDWKTLELEKQIRERLRSQKNAEMRARENTSRGERDVKLLPLIKGITRLVSLKNHFGSEQGQTLEDKATYLKQIMDIQEDLVQEWEAWDDKCFRADMVALEGTDLDLWRQAIEEGQHIQGWPIDSESFHLVNDACEKYWFRQESWKTLEVSLHMMQDVYDNDSEIFCFLRTWIKGWKRRILNLTGIGPRINITAFEKREHEGLLALGSHTWNNFHAVPSILAFNKVMASIYDQKLIFIHNVWIGCQILFKIKEEVESIAQRPEVRALLPRIKKHSCTNEALKYIDTLGHFERGRISKLLLLVQQGWLAHKALRERQAELLELQQLKASLILVTRGLEQDPRAFPLSELMDNIKKEMQVSCSRGSSERWFAFLQELLIFSDLLYKDKVMNDPIKECFWINTVIIRTGGDLQTFMPTLGLLKVSDWEYQAKDQYQSFRDNSLGVPCSTSTFARLFLRHCKLKQTKEAITTLGDEPNKDKMTQKRGCFGRGFVFHTPRGLVKVENLVQGDKIWSSDILAREGNWVSIHQIITLREAPREVWEVADLHFVTPDHLVWDFRKLGWIRLESLPPLGLVTTIVEEVYLLVVAPTCQDPWVWCGKFCLRLLGGMSSHRCFVHPKEDVWWLYFSSGPLLTECDETQSQINNINKDILGWERSLASARPARPDCVKNGVWRQASLKKEQDVWIKVMGASEDSSSLMAKVYIWEGFFYRWKEMGHWTSRKNLGMTQETLSLLNGETWSGRRIDSKTCVWEHEKDILVWHMSRQGSGSPLPHVQDLNKLWEEQWENWIKTHELNLIDWSKVKFLITMTAMAAYQMLSESESWLEDTQGHKLKITRGNSFWQQRIEIKMQGLELDCCWKIVSTGKSLLSDFPSAGPMPSEAGAAGKLIKYFQNLELILETLVQEMEEKNREVELYGKMFGLRFTPGMLGWLDSSLHFRTDISWTKHRMRVNKEFCGMRVFLLLLGYANLFHSRLLRATDIFRDGLSHFTGENPEWVSFKTKSLVRTSKILMDFEFSPGESNFLGVLGLKKIHLLLFNHFLKKRLIKNWMVPWKGGVLAASEEYEKINQSLGRRDAALNGVFDPGLESFNNRVGSFLSSRKTLRLIIIWDRFQKFQSWQKRWKQACEAWKGTQEAISFRDQIGKEVTRGEKEQYKNALEGIGIWPGLINIQLLGEKFMSTIRDLDKALSSYISCSLSVRGWGQCSKKLLASTRPWSEELGKVKAFINLEDSAWDGVVWPLRHHLDVCKNRYKTATIARLERWIDLIKDETFSQGAAERQFISAIAREADRSFKEDRGIKYTPLGGCGSNEDEAWPFWRIYWDEDLMGDWLRPEAFNLMMRGEGPGGPFGPSEIRLELETYAKYKKWLLGKIEGRMNPYGGEGPGFGKKKKVSHQFRKRCRSFSLLVLDTETSGLSNLKDKLLQVGWKRIKIGFCFRKNKLDKKTWAETETRQIVIRHKDFVIDESGRAFEVNNISNKLVQDQGMSLEEAQRTLRKVFLTTQAIVAHNVDFDLGFLASLWDKESWEETAFGKIIGWDTMSLAESINNGCRLSLEAFYNRLMGTTIKARHRAEADVDLLTTCLRHTWLAARWSDIWDLLLRKILQKVKKNKLVVASWNKSKIENNRKKTRAPSATPLTTKQEETSIKTSQMLEKDKASGSKDLDWKEEAPGREQEAMTHSHFKDLEGEHFFFAKHVGARSTCTDPHCRLFLKTLTQRLQSVGGFLEPELSAPVVDTPTHSEPWGLRLTHSFFEDKDIDWVRGWWKDWWTLFTSSLWPYTGSEWEFNIQNKEWTIVLGRSLAIQIWMILNSSKKCKTFWTFYPMRIEDNTQILTNWIKPLWGPALRYDCLNQGKENKDIIIRMWLREKEGFSDFEISLYPDANGLGDQFWEALSKKLGVHFLSIPRLMNMIEIWESPWIDKPCIDWPINVSCDNIFFYQGKTLNLGNKGKQPKGDGGLSKVWELKNEVGKVILLPVALTREQSDLWDKSRGLRLVSGGGNDAFLVLRFGKWKEKRPWKDITFQRGRLIRAQWQGHEELTVRTSILSEKVKINLLGECGEIRISADSNDLVMETRSLLKKRWNKEFFIGIEGNQGLVEVFDDNLPLGELANLDRLNLHFPGHFRFFYCKKEGKEWGFVPGNFTLAKNIGLYHLRDMFEQAILSSEESSQRKQETEGRGDPITPTLTWRDSEEGDGTKEETFECEPAQPSKSPEVLDGCPLENTPIQKKRKWGRSLLGATPPPNSRDNTLDSDKVEGVMNQYGHEGPSLVRRGELDGLPTTVGTEEKKCGLGTKGMKETDVRSSWPRLPNIGHVKVVCQRPLGPYRKKSYSQRLPHSWTPGLSF